MDIGFPDTTTLSEKGAEFEILNPKTLERTHLYFTILGPDSKRYTQIVKDVMAEMARKNTKSATMDDLGKDIVIRSVLGFRAEKLEGEKWVNEKIELDGQELIFSEPNVRKIIELMPTIWAHLAEIQKNRGNFLRKSATN